MASGPEDAGRRHRRRAETIADGIAIQSAFDFRMSYGGYRRCSAASRRLYACAASWAGVSDLGSFLSTLLRLRLGFGDDLQLERRLIGRTAGTIPQTRRCVARERSENQCPILLRHGSADNTVRIDQSENMIAPCGVRTTKVTFITIEVENDTCSWRLHACACCRNWRIFLAANIGTLRAIVASTFGN